MRRIVYALGLAFVSIGCIACRRNVVPSDLVGRWHLVNDDTARAHLQGKGTVEGHFELMSSGEFKAAGMPCLVLYMSQPDGSCEGLGPVSGEGSWAISDKRSIILTFKTQTDGGHRVARPIETDVMIGKGSPLYLYKWADDPDSGEAYRFESDAK